MGSEPGREKIECWGLTLLNSDRTIRITVSDGRERVNVALGTFRSTLLTTST